MKTIKAILFLALLIASISSAQYTYLASPSDTSSVKITGIPDTAYFPHNFSCEDSLVRKANYTPYVAGYALNDSTSANPKVLVFTLPYSGWEGQITDCYATSDSSNTKVLRLTLYRDSTSIPRTADGAAIAYKANNLIRRIGSVDITIAGNTATAGGASGSSGTFAGMTFTSTITNQIYGVVEELIASTPQKNEHYYFKIKGWIRRPLP
jgi:hypothetical protein